MDAHGERWRGNWGLTFRMFSANLSYSSRTSCSRGVRSSFCEAEGDCGGSAVSILFYERVCMSKVWLRSCWVVDSERVGLDWRN